MPNLNKLWLYLGRHQVDHTDLSTLQSLVRFNRLKVLCLQTYGFTVATFHQLIPIWFPNLQRLTLKIEDKEMLDLTELSRVIVTDFRYLTNFEIK